MTSLENKFEEAIRFHQLGQLAQAKALYEEIVVAQPDYAEVLHLLGIIYYQMGQLQRAVDFYDQAISFKPDFSDAYSNRGLALHDLKQFEEAIKSYDQAIHIKPDFIDAYFNRGLTFHELKQLQEAVASYNQAITFNPDHMHAYSNRGNALQELKRFEEAVASYDQAIAINPDYAEAYFNRGHALEELKRLEDACTSYDKAIANKPDYAQAYLNRGLVLQKLDRLEAAVASFDQAINFQADYAQAYSNRGNVLQTLKQYDEAIASFDRAIAIKPDYAEAYFNRGCALKESQQAEESIASFDRAIAIKPDYAEAYFNRGLVLSELKRLDEAIASYDQAVQFNPHHEDAQWSKALVYLSKAISLLSAGDFARGWELYEWRFKQNKAGSYATKIINRWNGEKIEGSLLILAEQGIGDEILYAGMFNDLRGMAGKIMAYVDPRLVPLYERSFKHIEFIPEVSDFITVKESNAQIYMPSLGCFFRQNQQSLQKVKVPYLQANPERTRQLREKLSQSKKIICGLSWVSKNPESGDKKTMGLKDLTEILSLPGIEFINLQYGDTTEEQTTFYSETGVKLTQVPEVDNFKDIDGLASLIDACDLVLTISNSTAHIAGALGKEVIIMLPYSKGLHWYWHDGNYHNPWYPTAKLLKQEKSGDWESVVSRVKLIVEEKINKISEN